MKQDRTAFIVSDRTGLTAEAMAHSLLSQFPDVKFQTRMVPFVDDDDKALQLKAEIDEIATQTGDRALVFVTLIDDHIRDIVNSANCVVYDLFDTFIGPMERELSEHSSHTVGKSHGVNDNSAYTSRIAAVHFSMQTDDGLETNHYDRSDLIITGVSRSGKTPTSLYLSLHYGLFVSNYPLTEDELDRKRLPDVLVQQREKVFGLTIEPQRLLQIRQERYKGDSYSSAQICQTEVAQAENIFRTARIPYLNTTRMSVEEIGATIVHKAGLLRRATI